MAIRGQMEAAAVTTKHFVDKLKSIHHKVNCLHLRIAHKMTRQAAQNDVLVLRRNQFVCIAQDKKSTLKWIDFRLNHIYWKIHI